MPASVETMFPIASSRTVSTRSMLCWVATSRRVWFDWLIALKFQNVAIAVCSSDRNVLLLFPYFVVSFRSAIHCGSVRAGGAGARDWGAVGTQHGFMTATHGVCLV